MEIRRGLGLTVLLAAMAVAPAAHAADVGLRAGGLATYSAAAGEVNSPTFTETASGLVVEDPTAPLAAPDGGCEVSADKHMATCDAPDGIEGLDVTLGDGDDTATVNVTGPQPADRDAPQSLRVEGGAGDDTLTGSDTTADMLLGDAGADTLRGRGDGDPEVDPGQYPYPGYPWEGSWTDKGNELHGGPGDDTLAGGAGEDGIDGDDGDDSFTDEDGLASMNGGPGDDRFVRVARAGDDEPGHASIFGAEGRDTVSYSVLDPADPDGVKPDPFGATIRLVTGGATTGNGTPGQEDRLLEVEDAIGTDGNDTITASPTASRLSGRGGDDTIVSHHGADEVEGGGGADSIDVADREGGDRVLCGEQAGGDPGDTVTSDPGDVVDRCPAPPPPPADSRNGQGAPDPERTPIPTLRLALIEDATEPDISGTKLARRVKLATLRRRGYKVTVRSADAGPNALTVKLTGRRNGRAVTLARRNRSFTGATTVRLKPPRRKARAIRRGARLRLVVEVHDAAGNTARRSVTVKVR